ncbi:MAG: Bax inhibitor-1/YccA family protein [Prevotella sp.]|jgi:FtsH-binding integral membrane protein|nr:Bax inhibitor-1/YccA family protein [Prevotella sp.]
MEFNDFERMVNEKEAVVQASFPAVMRKVYLWMTLALIITAITSFGVATSPALFNAIVSSKVLFFGIIIAEVALVWGVSASIHKLSLTTATLLFILYSVLNGITLSFIFIAYSISVVSKVFFITAGTFAAMAFIGYTTKKDLSGMGKILTMGLIGLIIASLVNMFLRSTGFEYILSYVGVAIFVGLTAYDSQKIRQLTTNAIMAGESEVTVQKYALLGALSLYLDFINLFLYLLRIFGNSRN